MKRKPKADNPWVMFHMGLEFAGAAVVLALIGWFFVDRKFGTEPWGALIGATIGFVGGGYLFIKEALLANKLAMKDYKGRRLGRGLTGKPSLMKDGQDKTGEENSAGEVSGEDDEMGEDKVLPDEDSEEESDINDSLEEDQSESEKRENQ